MQCVALKPREVNQQVFDNYSKEALNFDLELLKFFYFKRIHYNKLVIFLLFKDLCKIKFKKINLNFF